MAPGNLCLHDGDEAGGLATWAGMRVIYSCCTCPPRAPTPVPGTCHPDFCDVRISILESWWEEILVWAGSHGGEASMATGAPPCLPDEELPWRSLDPQADRVGKTGMERSLLSR